MTSNYYKRQLEKIVLSSDYVPTITVYDSEGNTTHHLSLNSESIPELIEWLTDFNFNSEVGRLRRLIEGSPDDIKLLKREYYELTGKNYRRNNK
jgi:hypothetical protein